MAERNSCHCLSAMRKTQRRPPTRFHVVHKLWKLFHRTSRAAFVVAKKTYGCEYYKLLQLMVLYD